MSDRSYIAVSESVTAQNALCLGGTAAGTYAPLTAPSFTTCTTAPVVCASTCAITPIACASTCVETPALRVNLSAYAPDSNIIAMFESENNCEAVRIYGWSGSTGNNTALRVYNQGGTSNGGNCAIFAYALYNTPVSSGRSHGIWSIAGNKTNRYNYGVIGQLCGAQEGAGIVGVLSGWSTTLPVGCWAGVFEGNTYHGGNISFGTGAARTIGFNATSSGVGSTLQILGNNGSSTSAGGNILIQAGSAGGGTLNDGGNICIIGGSSPEDYGGNIFISGGEGDGVCHGCVQISVGTQTSFLALPSSCTSLYYSGSEKLKTTTAGVEVTGTVCASSWMCATDFKLSSDCRLKTNIEAINISPINVEYKQFELISEPNRLRYGVIAQELQITNPELVSTGDDGYMSVSYIDLLIKEIASLKCRVVELEKKLE